MPLSVGEKGDIDPVGLDKSITFDCVGGLDAHVNSLKVWTHTCSSFFGFLL